MALSAGDRRSWKARENLNAGSVSAMFIACSSINAPGEVLRRLTQVKRTPVPRDKSAWSLCRESLGKGTPCHDTVGAKHDRCIQTHNRGHATATNRARREFMRWRAGCGKSALGSVGALREQSLRATRSTPTPESSLVRVGTCYLAATGVVAQCYTFGETIRRRRVCF